MCKPVYRDLLNSNMNRDVQTGCTGYVHIAAISAVISALYQIININVST